MGRGFEGKGDSGEYYCLSRFRRAFEKSENFHHCDDLIGS